MKTTFRKISLAILAGGALAGLRPRGVPTGPSDPPVFASARLGPSPVSPRSPFSSGSNDAVDRPMAGRADGGPFDSSEGDASRARTDGASSPQGDAPARTLRDLALSGALEPALAALAPERPRALRQEALEVMVEFAGEGAWSTLALLAGKDEDPELRAQALLHLARIDPISALGHLEPALSDSDPGVRRVALRSLGAVRTSRSLEWVLACQAAEGDLEAVRAQAFALRDLSAAGPDSARSGLLALLERQDLDSPTRATVRDLALQLQASAP